MKKMPLIFLSFLLLAGCSQPKTATVNGTNTNQNIQKENTNQTGNALIKYQNTEYGFSLDYPKDWLINKPTPAINDTHVKLELISPEREKSLKATGGYDMTSEDIYISVFESTTELPSNAIKKLGLEEWLQKEGAGLGLFNIEKTTFAGSPAFQTLSSSADEADPEIYVEHKGKIYLIHSEIGNESQKTQNEKIIQTFKWIN